MCGIIGFINCGSKEELERGVSKLIHRGPDSQNSTWFSEKRSGLGHTRLSIIDLSANAVQPMRDADNGNIITFNGEIYNYKEIRSKLESYTYSFSTNSDTEVILKAYDKWGEDCLNYFNGMFAFCIYNPQNGKVFIARDRLGIKPLYYHHLNKTIAFSSEIKGILELHSYKKEIDYLAIQTPAHFQIAPYTGFKDILKLPAGHFISFNDQTGFKLNKYWDIEISDNPIGEMEAIEKLDYLVNDAVNLNLVSDVPIGVLLSGGLDSSLVAALTQNKSRSKLNTFTIKFDEKNLKLQGNVDDSYYVKMLAEKHGFIHHEIELNANIVDLLPKLIYHLDEPLSDPAALNTYLISQVAKEKGISVLLNGIGVDEVFGGYRSQLACLKAENYQKLVPLSIRSFIESSTRNLKESNAKKDFKYVRWIKRFIESASLNQFERQLLIKNSALNNKNFNEFYLNKMDLKDSIYYSTQKEIFYKLNTSYLNKMCYLDTKYYMTDHNLNYSDKSMMAFGVEGRPTLVDHRIVEFMFSINCSYKIRKNTQKYLLKKVAEKYLPKEIIYRPKSPFSAPLRGWLKNELNEMVNDTLSYETIKKRGIYNPDHVQKLILENKKGRQDNSQLIWRLIINELWFKTFFK